MEELRNSHALIAEQVPSISQELADAQKVLASDRAYLRHCKEDFNRRILPPLIKFGAGSVLAALSTPSIDMTRLNFLCPANAVEQSVLKSHKSDCTLLEFQTMATNCSRKSSIKCDMPSSHYYVAFLNAAKADRFEIVVPTFFDFL